MPADGPRVRVSHLCNFLHIRHRLNRHVKAMMPGSAATALPRCRPPTLPDLRTMTNAQTKLLLASALLVLAILPACSGEEDIRTYEVPKVAEAPATKDGSVTKTGTGGTGGTANPLAAARLLAAIIPREDGVWHMRVSGASVLVTPQIDNFKKVVASAKFVAGEDGKQVPKFTLPTGWTQKPGTGMRYVTLSVGEAAHGLEVAVTKLGLESGDVFGNAERYAGMVGLSSVTKAQVAEMTSNLEVDGKAAVILDINGPGGGGSMAANQGAAGGDKTPRKPPGQEKIKVAAPAGWTKNPNPSQFIAEAYDFNDGDQTMSLTISSAGGGIPANINRWRGQIGLEAWDELGFQKAVEGGKEIKEIKVGGADGVLIDLNGPSVDGKPAERILGAIIEGEQAFWFFKLRGPATLIEKRRGDFDLFLQSVKFEIVQ